jgi:diguanylate cyclase (GGDEF)-like protein
MLAFDTIFEDINPDLSLRLKEATFLAEFSAAVNRTLDVESIYTAAARVLYYHFRFRLLVIETAADLGGHSIAYSSVGNSHFRLDRDMALSRFPRLKKENVQGHRSLGLVNPNDANVSTIPLFIELPDEMGRVVMLVPPNFAQLISDRVAAGAGEALVAALANSIEYTRIRDLSMRDPLTGLFNRRVMEEMLEIEACRRELSSFSLLILDLDDFKKINDTYGHAAGDEVLKWVATVMRQNFRKHDIIARYGGEEFAVLLPSTSAQTATEIGERLRKRIEGGVFAFDGKAVSITASIGIAHRPVDDSCCVREMMQKADHALYRAKNSGKNRICLYGGTVRKMPVRKPARQEGQLLVA